MIRLTRHAEELLKEIIDHRDENGNCDTTYWGNRFEDLSLSDEMLLRSTFKELIEAEMISVKWADNYPYIMFVLSNGFSYFEEKESELMKETTYNNNFFGDVNGLQIQQGNRDATQKQTIEHSYDEDKIMELIQAIKKYDNLLESEFGKEGAMQLRECVSELSETTKTPDSKNKTGAILSCIRDLCVNAGGSLIASGVIQLISSIVR